MTFIKQFWNFLMEFLQFLGYFILIILMFVAFNKLMDMSNPCSNFSDTQDLCSKG